MIVNIEAYNRWAEQKIRPIVEIIRDATNTFEVIRTSDLTKDKTLDLIHKAWAKYDAAMKNIDYAHMWQNHIEVVSARYLMYQSYEVLLMKWDL